MSFISFRICSSSTPIKDENPNVVTNTNAKPRDMYFSIPDGSVRGFQGLSRSTSKRTLMDGMKGGHWWYSVGYGLVETNNCLSQWLLNIFFTILPATLRSLRQSSTTVDVLLCIHRLCWHIHWNIILTVNKLLIPSDWSARFHRQWFKYQVTVCSQGQDIAIWLIVEVNDFKLTKLDLRGPYCMFDRRRCSIHRGLQLLSVELGGTRTSPLLMALTMMFMASQRMFCLNRLLHWKIQPIRKRFSNKAKNQAYRNSFKVIIIKIYGRLNRRDELI